MRKKLKKEIVTLIGFIFLIASTKATFTSEGFNPTVFEVSKDRQDIFTVVLKLLVTSSHLQCVHRCRLQDGCQNTNYNTKTKECQLIGESFDNTKSHMRVNKGWMIAENKLCGKCPFQEQWKINGICPIAYFQEEITLRKNFLLGTIPFWSARWKISFDIKPLSSLSGSNFYSVLHLSIGGNNKVHGDRIPAIWFKTKTGQIHIASSVNGDINHRKLLPALPLNIKSRIEIKTISKEGEYIYSVHINGEKKYSIINNDAREFKNVNVYAGDPWYEPANAKISNLLITNLL